MDLCCRFWRRARSQKPVISMDVQTGADPVIPRIRTHHGSSPALATAAAAPAVAAAAEKKPRNWLSTSLRTLMVIAVW